MKPITYHTLENFMLSCMTDSAHDKEHIYRVLYHALEIAKTEAQVDYDVLIGACLLHDIGRKEELENPQLCHALVGGEKAYAFLLQNGFSENYAHKVKQCIQSHRYRKNNPPQSLEAKILFDADKLDVSGAMGIARTLLHQGVLSEPLYSRLPDGTVSNGENDKEPSFFQEYKYKLEHIDQCFHTKRGAQLARERNHAAHAFYLELYKEVTDACEKGMEEIKKIIR